MTAEAGIGRACEPTSKVLENEEKNDLEVKVTSTPIIEIILALPAT